MLDERVGSGQDLPPVHHLQRHGLNFMIRIKAVAEITIRSCSFRIRFLS
eukprot:COSAG01_NODE_251_length_20305_cov_5.846447_19_plen_49_part_00